MESSGGREGGVKMNRRSFLANDGLTPDTQLLTLSIALAKSAKAQLEADIVIILGNA